jgi:glycogen debranching enzyme
VSWPVVAHEGEASLAPTKTVVPDEGEASLAPTKPSQVSKAGSLFAVFDGAGDIDSGQRAEAGVYFNDTRFVDRLRLRLGGRPLQALRVEGGGHRFAWDLSLPGAGGRPGVTVRRERVLAETILETISLHNPARRTFRATLRIEVGGDFRSMFAVRGLAGQRPGRMSQRWGGRSGTMSYLGADGRRRSAHAIFTPPPDALSRGRARYRLRLAPGASFTVQLSIQLREQGQPPLALQPATGLLVEPRVETDFPPFDNVLEVALSDLRMLVSRHGRRSFLAAGIPWFVALFGRDSILSALQCLAFEPALARDTLLLLARFQGQRFDARREEEPGKILHELRRDELSNLGRIPFSPYYGTVDATPLFLILLGEYIRWTGDLRLWHRLRPAAERALTWIREHGDHDGDGFLDYEQHGLESLANQGWKDSGNSIVNLDGSLAEPPIALVEVQAYAYRARLELAALYRADGDQPRAEELEREASGFRRRLLAAYWMPDRRYLAVALQRGGRRVETITSNAGHALWAGCLSREQARAVARRLMDHRMFSGWGIRTLAEGEPRYDPADYQVGAVWPHDNALIAAGLKRYGRQRDFERVFTAIVEAALHVPGQRLPELLGGHQRTAGAPVPYPAAASPQAWSAGSVPYLLVTALGLEPDAIHGRLHVRQPQLPRWLGLVEMRGLRIGGERADLGWRRRGTRTEVATLGQTNALEVLVEV